MDKYDLYFQINDLDVPLVRFFQSVRPAFSAAMSGSFSLRVRLFPDGTSGCLGVVDNNEGWDDVVTGGRDVRLFQSGR